MFLFLGLVLTKNSKEFWTLYLEIQIVFYSLPQRHLNNPLNLENYVESKL